MVARSLFFHFGHVKVGVSYFSSPVLCELIEVVSGLHGPPRKSAVSQEPVLDLSL